MHRTLYSQNGGRVVGEGGVGWGTSLRIRVEAVIVIMDPLVPSRK